MRWKHKQKKGSRTVSFFAWLPVTAFGSEGSTQLETRWLERVKVNQHYHPRPISRWTSYSFAYEKHKDIKPPYWWREFAKIWSK